MIKKLLEFKTAIAAVIFIAVSAVTVSNLFVFADEFNKYKQYNLDKDVLDDLEEIDQRIEFYKLKEKVEGSSKQDLINFLQQEKDKILKEHKIEKEAANYP